MTDREQALSQELVQARARIATLEQEVKVLRLKVDALARKLFGKSSEKLNAEELQTVFATLLEEQNLSEAELKKDNASANGANGSEAETPQALPSSTARRPKRKLEDIIAGLPVHDVIIDPEEVKADPEQWQCIGAEETKLIDYTPGQFSCQRILRRKFVSKAQRHLPPITAALNTLQERCTATPALLAHTMTQRFEMHLPFYRIEQIYARLGVPITRQTMCNWSGMSAQAARLVVEAIKWETFADGYVEIDETPVKYQDPGREGVCGTGWLWVTYNPVRKVCLFQWRQGRGAEELETIVPKDFKGTLQCDGHSAYGAFARSPERAGTIDLAGCLAHARRKFFEAKAEGEDPQWVLGQMQQLYHIEARLAEARAGPEQVLATRERESKPMMKRIHDRLEQLRTTRKHFPRSLTGEAITYACNQWERLEVFLRDGRVRIDNNLVENAIRPSAIGKKNWLFMGDPDSGERAATFYTLIGNCHRVGIDAYAYLKDLFTRLPTETTETVKGLTPAAWAAEQASKRQVFAQATTSTVLM